jgi:hypothetical protein
MNDGDGDSIYLTHPYSIIIDGSGVFMRGEIRRASCRLATDLVFMCVLTSV